MSRKEAIAALAEIADSREPEAAREAIEAAREQFGDLLDEYRPLLVALERRLEDHFQCQRLAGTDPLTGVCNRRGFERALEREVARHERSGEALAIVALDLDDLKPLNDRFGHAAGDEAIVAVASCCEDLLRKTDLVARMGGDEFAVLLPGADDVVALAVARRLRQAIEAIQVQGVSLRVSLGVSVLDTQPEGRTDLVQRADAALYADKVQRKGAAARSGASLAA